jgi:hypothetical protein
MCRSATGDHTNEIACGDGVGIGSAHTVLRTVAEGIDAAGPHAAVPATQAEGSESALGLHLLEAVPDCFNVLFVGPLRHNLRSLVCMFQLVLHQHTSSSKAEFFRKSMEKSKSTII